MTTVESPAGTTTPLKGIRKVAARRMVEAWAIPVFHLTVEVDMTRSRVDAGDRAGDQDLRPEALGLMERAVRESVPGHA